MSAQVDVLEQVAQALGEIAPSLPEAHQERWREISGRLRAEDALTVCVVGPFSAGKSSLINALLGEPLLPTGMDETTAVPTIVRHGDRRRFAFASASDERVSDLQEVPYERFEALAAKTTVRGEHAEVVVTAPWLQGLTLVDLPGLGSTHQERASVTHAEIAASDVVLYMLAVRGPTRADLEAIERAVLRGKTVRVLVARWDEVLAAQARGERAPELDAWAAQINERVSATLEISAVSTAGHGLEEVRWFLNGLGAHRAQIRARRALTEAIDTLDAICAAQETRLELSARAQREGTQALRGELLAQRGALIDMREQLRGEHDAQRDAHLASVEAIARAQATALDEALAERWQALHDAETPEAWEAQLEHLHTLGERYLEPVVAECDTLAQELAAPPASWSNANLPFPTVEVHEQDWWQSAEQTRLAEQIEALTSQLDALAGAELDPELAQDYEAALQDLQALSIQLSTHDQQLAHLPQIQRTIGGQPMFATAGRALGEVADIALIFVNPSTIGKKLVGYLGKGSRIAKYVPQALKMGQRSAKAKRLRQGVERAFETQAAAVGHGELHQSNSFGRALERLDWLDKFSLGYVFQSVGSWFDEPSSTIYETDPEALAAHEQTRALIEHERQRAVADVRALEESLASAEQSALARRRAEADLERARKRLDAHQLELQESAAQIEAAQATQLAARKRLAADRATEQTRQAFEGRTRGLLLEVARGWQRRWHEELEVAITAQQRLVESLHDELETLQTRDAQTTDTLSAQLTQLKHARAHLTTLATEVSP